MQKLIKILMIEKNMKIADVADTIGLTPRSLSTKLSKSNSNMTLGSMTAIFDALQCDLVVRDRATGKIYDIGSVAPVGDIGAVDSGVVTPQNNSKKQKLTN